MVKRMRVIKIIIIVFLLAVVLYVAHKMIVIHSNNNYLSDYFQMRVSLPIFEKTKIFREFSDMGLLIGNGNHMDFFNATIYETQLDDKEVKDFVEKWKLGVGLVLKNDFSKTDAICESYHSPKIRSFFDDFKKLEGKYFILYETHSIPNNGDLRGM